MAKREPAKVFGLLSVVQLLACVIILWQGVPFYRSFLEVQHRPDTQLSVTVLGCAFIMQLTYWKAYALRREVSVTGSAFLAHLLQFASRLIFIFPSAMFSLVFIQRFDQLDLGVVKVALLILLLFSVFCFTRHLEWVAQSMRSKAREEGGGS